MQKYTVMSNLFNERKTAQAAAYLLHRAGGQLPLIKLLKLMYLAERLSLKEYGEPLTGDSLVSMEHGPVLSRTLNQMNGAVVSVEGGWDTWVSDRSNHNLVLKDPSMNSDPSRDLLALSDSDLECLASVWEQFGRWDRWDLVKYTHDNCGEWSDPGQSSSPIAYEAVFHALGFTEPQVTAMTKKIYAQERIQSAFA